MTDWEHEHEILAAAHKDLGTAHDRVVTVLKETVVPTLVWTAEMVHKYRCNAIGCTDGCENIRAALKAARKLAPG